MTLELQHFFVAKRHSPASDFLLIACSPDLEYHAYSRFYDDALSHFITALTESRLAGAIALLPGQEGTLYLVRFLASRDDTKGRPYLPIHVIRFSECFSAKALPALLRAREDLPVSLDADRRFWIDGRGNKQWFGTANPDSLTQCFHCPIHVELPDLALPTSVETQDLPATESPLRGLKQLLLEENIPADEAAARLVERSVQAGEPVPGAILGLRKLLDGSATLREQLQRNRIVFISYHKSVATPALLPPPVTTRAPRTVKNPALFVPPLSTVQERPAIGKQGPQHPQSPRPDPVAYSVPRWCKLALAGELIMAVTLGCSWSSHSGKLNRDLGLQRGQTTNAMARADKFETAWKKQTEDLSDLQTRYQSATNTLANLNNSAKSAKKRLGELETQISNLKAALKDEHDSRRDLQAEKDKLQGEKDKLANELVNCRRSQQKPSQPQPDSKSGDDVSSPETRGTVQPVRAGKRIQ